MENKSTRRLAAIMFTDIQGYTSLMQESEAKAIQVREKHRNIFETTTAEFDGDIINYYGDGTLSIFSSAIKAVHCAIEMQKHFIEVPSIPVRIGIHLGDIIKTPEDIIGNSVNIAARVESLGVSGSILISDKVYEEIKNQESLNAEYVGDFHFKNDQKTRKIYAVVSEGLIVPERHQMSGKTQDKSNPKLGKFGFRPITLKSIAVLIILLMLATVFGYNYFKNQNLARWAEKEAIPQIEKLKVQNQYKKAFELALEAQEYIPDDPKLKELINSVSDTINLVTIPPDTRVLRRLISDTEENWEFVGNTPLNNIQAYRGKFVWRLEKAGYETVERLHHYTFMKSGPGTMDTILLYPEGKIPDEMVYVPSTNWSLILPGISLNTKKNVPAFFMDRYEISNQDYKNFVDNGAYSQESYWKYPFIKDGMTIPWEEAMAFFIDKTNRPGPAEWQVSDFPEGEEFYPVGGISWYEAAAYAEYVNKSLPTIFHFNTAQAIDIAELIIPNSNFSNTDVAKIGSYKGVGAFGTYDLAGNVREWQQTVSSNGSLRFVLGGAWNEPYYAASDAYAQDPFDRSEINGFRCIKYLEDSINKEQLEISVELLDPSSRNMNPVDNTIYANYLRQFDYDPSPLNIELQKLSINSEDFSCEKATIDAAYGNERFDIYCYLPTNVSPPYQAVIIFPGAGVLYSSEYSHDWMEEYRYILKSGRAIIFPVYNFTFERQDVINRPDGFPDETVLYKDQMIMWTKDFSRTIDYLEERDDIDTNNIAFFGLSWGGITGGVIPAVEKRIKAVVLTIGGLTPQSSLPEVDQLNHLPRIKQPFLMLNGKYDFYFPFKSSQVPMFELVGTPIADKKHVVSETSHLFPRQELIKETLDWLDKYLTKEE